MKNLFILSFLALLLGCTEVHITKPISEINEESLKERLTQLSARAASMVKDFPIDSNRIPRALEADGSLMASTSRDWTSGFYAGTLWSLYRFGGDESLRQAAEKWTAFEEKEKWDTHTHDLGFKLYCSFGEAYKTKPSQHYKDVLIQAAQTLSRRYHPTVGAIRSWDFNREIWQFPVIIDNMMNLELLFEAAELSGDSVFYNIAYQHALTTLDNHFRADYSSYHVIDYDTLSGGIRNRHTHQGASHESAWSRGQAWGLYGFTMAYRATKDPRFLEQAQAIAHFFFEHPNQPEDGIPYWDFNAPNIPDAYRDASAAAVAASGLVELSVHDPDNRDTYLNWADTVLKTLSSPEYQAKTPPFLLKHSVGNFPAGAEVDVPIVYADYYYVEALLRRLAVEQNRFPI